MNHRPSNNNKLNRGSSVDGGRGGGLGGDKLRHSNAAAAATAARGGGRTKRPQASSSTDTRAPLKRQKGLGVGHATSSKSYEAPTVASQAAGGPSTAAPPPAYIRPLGAAGRSTSSNDDEPRAMSLALAAKRSPPKPKLETAVKDSSISNSDGMERREDYLVKASKQEELKTFAKYQRLNDEIRKLLRQIKDSNNQTIIDEANERNEIEQKLAELYTRYEEAINEQNQSRLSWVQKLETIHRSIAEVYEDPTLEARITRSLEEAINEQNQCLSRVQKLETIHRSIAEMYENIVPTREARLTILHKAIRELRGNIRVYARIKPSDQPTSVHFTESTVSVRGPRKQHDLSLSPGCVFGPSSNQANVFNEVWMDIRSVLEGYNVCLMLYGQTGSGKTHTMLGGNEDMSGLLPRCLNAIRLHEIEKKKDGWEFVIEVSFIEIYNNELYDLLGDTRQKLKIIDNLPKQGGRMQVRKEKSNSWEPVPLKRIDLSNPNEINEILSRATTERSTAKTAANDTSSRSHAVFTINVTATHEHQNEVCGQLNLVDLCGSEAHTASERKDETVAINKNLHFLGIVLNAIQQNDFVDHRSCKLTHFLKPSLLPGCMLSFLVNINPTDYIASLQTLHFAENAQKCVLGKATQSSTKVSENTNAQSRAGSTTGLGAKRSAASGASAQGQPKRHCNGAAQCTLPPKSVHPAGVDAPATTAVAAVINQKSDTALRPLSPDEQRIVTKAIRGTGPPSEILASQDGDSVQRSSMQTLNPGQWLNDEVINYFCKICLAKRDEELCAKQPGRKRSHFFNSYFIQTMFDDKNNNPKLHGKYKYKNVKTWSKKVPGNDIFQLRYIFCPINLGNTHWTAAVIFMEGKRIQYYDSLGGTDRAKLEGLLEYVKDEYRVKNNGQEMDATEWELVDCTRDTPRQRNSFDCGVFTCMFCDFISKDCRLEFNQDYIDQCRERIALSIIKGCAIA